MKERLSQLRVRINAERLRSRFDALANIGATGDGGVHRPVFSDDHQRARRWFLQQAHEAGLETSVDGAGNHSAILACGPRDAPTLMLGSHLDSVPYGGRFDGALGVLAALETLQVVKEQALALRTHLEAIDFTDEEGTYLGFLGSMALSGTLDAAQLEHPGGDPEAFAAGLSRTGLTPASILSARRDPATIAGYLELHVEQGRRLIDADNRIGVVTGIVGIQRHKLTYTGRADHAGTISMEGRRDAAQGAAGFMVAARQLVMRDFQDCVVNTGVVSLEPGAINVVAEKARVALEFRSPTAHGLAALESALLRQAEAEARERELGFEAEKVDGIEPVEMGVKARDAVVAAAARLQLCHTLMPSGAGHDAQTMSRVCPAGMIFVPSIGGFSHSSREATDWDDCVNGANVLLQAALGGI